MSKGKYLKNNKELVVYVKTLFMAATEGKRTYSNKQISNKAGKKFNVEINYTTIGRWAKGKRPDTGLSWQEQFDLSIQKGLGIEPDNELEEIKTQLIKQTEEEYNQLLKSQDIGDKLQHLILSTILEGFEKELKENKDNKDFDPLKSLYSFLPEKITKLLPHIMLNITNRIKTYRELVANNDGQKSDKANTNIKEAIEEIRSLM